jgi:hypothetical protein
MRGSARQSWAARPPPTCPGSQGAWRPASRHHHEHDVGKKQDQAGLDQVKSVEKHRIQH